MGKTIKTGISFDPEVLSALIEFAKKYFEGNRSKAQNYIDRKALKISNEPIGAQQRLS